MRFAAQDAGGAAPSAPGGKATEDTVLVCPSVFLFGDKSLHDAEVGDVTW